MTSGPDYTLPVLREGEGALLLTVRAVPGSSRDRIVGVHGEALRVAVSAPPERGKANAALVEVLARELGLHRSSVRIEAGGASRDKRVRLEGASREEVLRRLREKLAPLARGRRVS